MDFDSDDSDFMLDDGVHVVVDVAHLAAEQDEASICDDEESRDSSSTSASVASSIVEVTITSSDDEDEETDQVIPKTPKNRSRVIESDPEEESSPEPPKPKKKRKRVLPINDSSDSEDDKQPSTSKGPAKRNLFERPKEKPDGDRSSDSDVQVIEDQKVAPRRSLRLENKRNPRPESPQRRYNITFEGGMKDDDGTDRSWDSEDPDEPAPEKRQCYICEELDPKLEVSGRGNANVSSWCECDCCVVTGQMGDYDKVCCQELKKVVEFMGAEVVLDRKCITEHPRFELDVLNFQALNRSNTKKSYRCTSTSKCFKAQWSFLRMVYDRIGFGGQAVVPACVSHAILNRFHRDDGLYYIWYAKYHCKDGPHCHKLRRSNAVRKSFKSNFRWKYSRRRYYRRRRRN